MTNIYILLCLVFLPNILSAAIGKDEATIPDSPSAIPEDPKDASKLEKRDEKPETALDCLKPSIAEANSELNDHEATKNTLDKVSDTIFYLKKRQDDNSTMRTKREDKIASVSSLHLVLKRQDENKSQEAGLIEDYKSQIHSFVKREAAQVNGNAPNKGPITLNEIELDTETTTKTFKLSEREVRETVEILIEPGEQPSSAKKKREVESETEKLTESEANTIIASVMNARSEKAKLQEKAASSSSQPPSVNQRKSREEIDQDKEKKDDSDSEDEEEDDDDLADELLQSKRENRKETKHWDHWGPWTSCSVSCGIGKITRWRHCIKGSCAPGEKEAQIQTCTQPECPR